MPVARSSTGSVSSIFAKPIWIRSPLRRLWCCHHAFAVDERAVPRLEVVDPGAAVLHRDLGVAPGDLGVDHQQVVPRVAADRPAAVQRRRPAGAGSADDLQRAFAVASGTRRRGWGGGHELERAPAELDLVAGAQRVGALEALAVHKRAVGGHEVLEHGLRAADHDPRVPSGELAGVGEDDVGAWVAAEHDVRRQFERALRAVALRNAQRSDRRQVQITARLS